MMPVGGILERTSSPVGKGAVCVSAGGGGEGPVSEWRFCWLGDSNLWALEEGGRGGQWLLLWSAGEAYWKAL